MGCAAIVFTWFSALEVMVFRNQFVGDGCTAAPVDSTLSSYTPTEIQCITTQKNTQMTKKLKGHCPFRRTGEPGDEG